MINLTRPLKKNASKWVLPLVVLFSKKKSDAPSPCVPDLSENVLLADLYNNYTN